MSEFDRVAALVGDYALVQQELGRLLRSEPLLFSLHHLAEQQDWDQTRALKTALVLLAARNADQLKQLTTMRADVIYVLTSPDAPMVPPPPPPKNP